MLSKGTVIGVFSAGYMQPTAIGGCSLLTLPANTAAIVIENTRLYAAEQAKRVSELEARVAERTTPTWKQANAALERRELPTQRGEQEPGNLCIFDFP